MVIKGSGMSTHEIKDILSGRVWHQITPIHFVRQMEVAYLDVFPNLSFLRGKDNLEQVYYAERGVPGRMQYTNIHCLACMSPATLRMVYHEAPFEHLAIPGTRRVQTEVIFRCPLCEQSVLNQDQETPPPLW